MGETTPTETLSTEWTKRQTLVENENLSASLDNYISQLEEIVGLTSQQIAALSNLARLHDILEHGDIGGKDRGVMHLSQNIPFVQLQFRLEDRMKELGEHLRRAQKAKSCVRCPYGGGGWDSEVKLTTEASSMMWCLSISGSSKMTKLRPEVRRTQLRSKSLLLSLSFLQLL